LDVAYTSIQQNNPDRLEIKLHIDKKLKSSLPEEGAVEHIHADTLEHEVDRVVEKISALKKEHPDMLWDDVAILVRANNHAEPFLRALESQGIPYEFISSSGLYRQPIVLDCFAFFKAIHSPYDALPIYRLFKSPCLALSERDVHAFTYFAKKKSISYIEALRRGKEFSLSKEGRVATDTLLSVLNKALSMARFEKPTAVLYHFLEESGYLSHLAREEEAGNREVIRQIYHLKQFFEVIQKYEQLVPGADVKMFVDYFEQILASGDDGKLYQPTDTPDSVNILTVHGSKGLEFKYVFIVNLVEERFPSRRRGDGIELPEALIKEDAPEGDHHYQEERRLFYVAATRAKERLYVTSADNYGGVRKKKMSRFLKELGYDAALQGVVKEAKKTDFTLQMPKEQKGVFVYELPKTFSFSQIRAFQVCKYQYKLAHILKIPMKGSPHFSFGTSMHSTLQKFYGRIQELNGATQESLFDLPKEVSVKSNILVLPFEELEQLYESSWIPDWYHSKRQREQYYKKGKEILKTFYASHTGVWTVPVSIEGGFKIKIGSYLVRGRIDRIDQLADGALEIIDYKTGKSKEKLSASDKEQLLLYLIAASRLPEYRHIGETKKLTFYYLNDAIKTSFEASEKDIVKAEDKMIKTLDEIHATDFATIGKKDMCGRCEFCAIGLV
jgi:DNA helicase-2/ATP-dependent DNA helicase PcrA